MTRRLPQALLLALLLLAVQSAVLSHQHADGSLPADSSAQSCDFCVGHASAAPAPEDAVPAYPDHRPIPFSGLRDEPGRPARLAAAHRSRAPPNIRSL